MEQQLLQRLVFGIVGALAIPVDRIEFFHQRDNREVQIERPSRQTLARCVQALARHIPLCRPLLIAQGDNAATRHRFPCLYKSHGPGREIRPVHGVTPQTSTTVGGTVVEMATLHW